MSSVKTWRRAALAAYIAAGVGLTGGGYALATVKANENAQVAALRAYVESWKDGQQEMAELATAATAAGDELVIDARPYPVPDWSAVAERAMPAVVMVSVMPRPMGDGSANRAWLIPGVQQNAATAALSGIRAVANGWAEYDQKRAWETRGAGVLVGDGRHALTAAHVLADTESVRVKLAGGEWRSARVVRSQEHFDVALLEIEGEPGQPASIAPALPRQGQAIAAIGSPAGLDYSMSAGIVSRYGVAVGLFAPALMMDTDARITGGNSGGPVFNARGEAVGIVSSSTHGFTHIVPINRALAVVGL